MLWYRFSDTEEMVSEYFKPVVSCYEIMIAFFKASEDQEGNKISFKSCMLGIPRA